MKIIVRIILIVVSLLFMHTVFGADVPADVWFHGDYPDGTILSGDGVTLIAILALIQSILLKVVLPIVVIGWSLYIAYQLFTAEGDESKMKMAWKSVTYTAIGLVSIAVSYAFVSVIARISL